MSSHPFLPAVIRKFHRCFVGTLNTIIYDPMEKLRITAGCPINSAVIKGCKSNENPISLLFFFTRLTFLQPWLPPPFLVTAKLVKAVDFRRMFYIGWYVINNPFRVATLVWIMWLNCDRKSSFFI
jgi:hypothetical protein